MTFIDYIFGRKRAGAVPLNGTPYGFREHPSNDDMDAAFNYIASIDLLDGTGRTVRRVGITNDGIKIYDHKGRVFSFSRSPGDFGDIGGWSTETVHDMHRRFSYNVEDLLAVQQAFNAYQEMAGAASVLKLSPAYQVQAVIQNSI